MSNGPPRPPRSPRFPLSAQIVLALVLGLVLGPFVSFDTGPLADIGKLVINMIKAAATPLLFLAIVNAVTKTEVSGKDGARMFGFSVVNASIALTIGLVLSNVLRPGTYLADHAPVAGAEAYAGRKIELIETLTSWVPQSIVQPFAENAVLPLVVLAVLIGVGLRRVRREGGDVAAIEQAAGALLRVTEIVLSWIIKLIPLAVFAVVLKTVSERGYDPFKGLGVYLGVGLLGLALHVAITYHAWLVLYARVAVRVFWRAAREPVVYAAGANSSLATLPLTLKALDKLGVSKSSSALGACVGTNLNNDGIILYEGMAVLFVAQASGIDLSLAQQIVIALTCLVAAMGVAGVPEAGFVSLALVLNTAGLPIEILPLLLTVDWVIARARSVVNVLSDMMLSILIDTSASRSPT